MNIQFKLRTDKAENADGCLIYLMFYYASNRYTYSTQCRSKVGDWDPAKNLPKKKHPYYEQVKSRIETIQERTKRLFFLRSPFGVPTPEQLRKHLDTIDVYELAQLRSQFVEYPGMLAICGNLLRFIYWMLPSLPLSNTRLLKNRYA
ncbi:Arm DNA-binding domain-containing protein [Siphonobacter sp. SORGH_AS_1065]|uniref:Arm DNA-binding domain-containing protein n=1 Tax=Siphonobacter sp. SORGH_AS_1065 TaxID=3041795 RepID=UPI00278716B4|nr:Arm DNA-binding domain-containing protein [Siphonobacter sp. SORGH_AS_1065]MDQ1089026.1 hypothetical protein [Siphonobacter sp. SORGH_AS_1065]